MSNEADTHLEEAWYNEQLALRCLKALKKNNIAGYYVPDRSQALEKVLKLIPPGATIGAGDSLTLTQTGIIAELEKRGSHRIITPLRREGKDYMPSTTEEWIEIGRNALSTDYFLTGLNAVTLDGKLVNTDGTGNRVSGLIFGPERVIAVAGINKIVTGVEEATTRIKTVAAPMNAHRYKIQYGADSPPCSINGVCVDCRHPERHCCYTVIVEFQNRPRIEVILIGEKLGL